MLALADIGFYNRFAIKLYTLNIKLKITPVGLHSW